MDDHARDLRSPIADVMKKRIVLLTLILILPGHLTADILLVDNRVRAGYEELRLPGTRSLACSASATCSTAAR